jgi:glucose/arabinose dehydrogenase
VLDKRAFAVALLAGACSERSATPPPPPGGVALEQVPGAFDQPLFVTAPPGDNARIFVVEQTGRIQIVRNGTLLTQPFLDLSGSVSYFTGGEQGLLGLAFHPNYAANGRLYVSYTDTAGDSRIVRYTVSGDPDVVDPQSADTVLMIDRQGVNYHNGGWIGFGPDGYLYMASGEAGVQTNGQSLGTLLGKILRLDVNGATGYAIPPDNPFVNTVGVRGEIWAYGVRNPWRPSFDRQTGDFYIADVGEDSEEEVNVQPAASRGGENYGWAVMEGRRCFEPPTGCDQTGLVQPVYAYATRPTNCAVTGGYVYRGTQVPALAGRYVFADYCSAVVQSFRWTGGPVVDFRDHTDTLRPPSLISSFGEDGRGELYLTSLDRGVWRFVGATP